MTTSRNWPRPSDYLEAIQSPTVSFASPRLRAARIRTSKNGLPEAASGKSAVVFRATAGGDEVALRCFTREASTQRERYQALHGHFAQALPAYLADFSYYDREILVTGEWYPVVEMAWVDGYPLDVWVGKHLRCGHDLADLAADWLKIVIDMNRRGMAHGDLSNDNCLIGKSSVTLIDYDGCYLPSLARSHPGEAGDPHFQHPARPGYYAPNIDAFPALVIYLSLLALHSDGALWKRYYSKENLIFVASDYLAPRATPVWQDLARNSAFQVRALTGALADMCEAPVGSLPALEDVVGGTTVRAAQPVTGWQAWLTSVAVDRASQDALGQGSRSQAASTSGSSSGSPDWLVDQLRGFQGVAPLGQQPRSGKPTGPRLPPAFPGQSAASPEPGQVSHVQPSAVPGRRASGSGQLAGPVKTVTWVVFMIITIGVAIAVILLIVIATHG